MKKTVITILALITLLATLASCGAKGGTTKELEGTLEEIMDSLYASAAVEFPVYNTEITADNAAYYLGTTDIEFEEALGSDPMMSAIAHSVVLIKMPDGADIESAKTKLRDNADPRKWICVGVDPEDVIVDSIGHTIMLVMSDSAPAFDEAFKALAG